MNDKSKFEISVMKKSVMNNFSRRNRKNSKLCTIILNYC